MKIEVLLDESRDIVATGPFKMDGDADEAAVELVPMAGQELVELEVDDEIASIETADELHAKLRSFL